MIFSGLRRWILAGLLVAGSMWIGAEIDYERDPLAWLFLAVFPPLIIIVELLVRYKTVRSSQHNELNSG